MVCVAQFTTTELPDYASAIVVSTPGAKLIAFNRDKLFLSIYRAVGHRSDALDSATQLTSTVIGKIFRTQAALDGVLTLNALAKLAHHALKRFDPLAAQTYLAYHQKTLGQ